MSEQDHIIRPVQGSDLEPLMCLKIITEKWAEEATKRRVSSEEKDYTTIAYAADSVAHALTKVSSLIEALLQNDLSTASEALEQSIGDLRPPRKVTKKDLLHQVWTAVRTLTGGDDSRTGEILTLVQLLVDSPNQPGNLLSVKQITPVSTQNQSGNRAQRRAKGKKR